MSTTVSDSRTAARVRIVETHVACENSHDLDGIMATFGAAAHYDDEPWDAHYVNHEGVRAFYAEMLRALPDFHIDVRRRHVGEDSIVLEVVIRGTHLGTWRGLPPTGRRIEFPLCGVFTFDDEDRLAGERIYYDRATMLRQAGVFHEPRGTLGRVATALSHPVTLLRLAGRMIAKRVRPWSRHA
jgi:steroid delta-isomerase-like uncharacterized protein